MERSGMEPYSDEWMAENATRVSGTLWEFVRTICVDYWMDSRAPNIIAETLEYNLDDQFHKKYKLSSGAIVTPVEVRYHGNGAWTYLGKVLSDDKHPPFIAFGFGDIDQEIV